MTKLDLVLARIRQLSPERQEALAHEIELRLDNADEEGSLLTDEEWAAIEPTLDEDQEEIPHAEIVKELRVSWMKIVWRARARADLISLVEAHL